MFWVCLILVIFFLAKEALEKELPAEYHNNYKLEEHDANEVRMGRMSQRQFMKNMNNGKYYAPSKEPGTLDPKLLREYYRARWQDSYSMKCKWGDNGEYDFIKNMSREEAREEYLKTFAQKLDNK